MLICGANDVMALGSMCTQLIPVLVLPGTAQVLVLLVCRSVSVYTAVLLTTCIHLTSDMWSHDYSNIIIPLNLVLVQLYLAKFRCTNLGKVHMF